MRQAVTKLGALTGLVLVIVAVLGGALLAPNGTWDATVRVSAGQAAIVIDPALVSVLGPRVSVQVTGRGEAGQRVPLFVGRARTDDANALIGAVRHLKITGLDGARRLDTRQADGGVALPRVDEADIWVERIIANGKVAQSGLSRFGAESVVVARTDGRPLPSVDVQVGWTNPWWFWIPLLIFVVGGALLVVTREPNRREARNSWSGPDNDGLVAGSVAEQNHSTSLVGGQSGQLSRRSSQRRAGGGGRRRSSTPLGRRR